MWSGQRISMCTLRPSIQPKLLQGAKERRNAGLSLRVIGGWVHEHTDAPYALAWLRPRRKRPRCRRTA
jgi:hypothetical protein